jgi:hypothetical protein
MPARAGILQTLTAGADGGRWPVEKVERPVWGTMYVADAARLCKNKTFLFDFLTSLMPGSRFFRFLNL